MSEQHIPNKTTRQLDPGSYHVLARTKDNKPSVGMVFAEGTAGEHIIEHWVLSEGHLSPTLDQSMVVEAIEENPFPSLPAFFRAMRERSRDWQSVAYIKATCEYHQRIPEL